MLYQKNELSFKKLAIDNLNKNFLKIIFFGKKSGDAERRRHWLTPAIRYRFILYK